VPTTFNPVAAKGKNASGPIVKRRFVKLDSAASDGETVKQCDTGGELAFGVSMFSVSASEITKGKGASVITEGRAIVEASEALAVGDPVATAADGRAAVAVSGDTVLGSIDEPATAEGNECTVHLWASGTVLA
jgi:hypothetical protein